MKDLVNGVRFELKDTDLTGQQKLDVISAVLDTLNELVDLKSIGDYELGYIHGYLDTRNDLAYLKSTGDYELGYMRGYHESYKRGYNFAKAEVEHERLQH